MLGSRDFLLRARLDAASLEAWIEAGWLVPRRAGPERVFSELDLARAWLIRVYRARFSGQ
jgi:chaperone modulatory protein CbpM